MIIPNKYSGYQAGIRLYPGGGGGGQPGTGDSQVGTTGGTTGITGAVIPPAPFANMAVNTQQGYDTLMGLKGKAPGQAGGAYNNLLTQGFNDGQIRSSINDVFGQQSNENFNQMVTNAGMTSPTGRPLAGSAQFYQPVYQPQYTNYARPTTQFDTSMYGTQPVQSPLSASGASRGDISGTINNWFNSNPGADINTVLAAMRGAGVNRTDIQAAGGVNNYGPQMSMPQTQQPFNPYTNNFGGFGGGFGGGFMPQQQFMPQMQTPFRQPTNNFSGGFGGGFGGFGGGFMPQQQFMPQMQQFQPQMNMGMQTPFSSGMSQPAAPRSSGPAQPIVSRSAGMRGTPNVMRRAEGGITSLMDKA
jgi:hypothetical protein